MLSNAIYPAFSRRPALFSRRIIAGELRDRLGFKGVAFTDDLDAPTTRRLGSAARRVLLSARAGADLILFAHSFPDVERASSALARAVRSGRLSRAKMERSVSRIRTLRESLGG